MVDMREKYETIALLDLKEMAKNRGIKGVSAMKKSDVIEAMLQKDRDDAFDQAGDKAQAKVQAKIPSKAQIPGRVQMPAKAGAADARVNAAPVMDRKEAMAVSMGKGKFPPVGLALPKRKVSENGEEESRDYDENDIADLDSGDTVCDILEVMSDGFGFIRCANYLPGDNDVYVAPSQIRRFGLKTGDIVCGNTRIKSEKEKFRALLYLTTVNGMPPEVAARRYNFEDMTPIFPNQKIKLETSGAPVSMRIMDLISPVGKGQRGLIVSQPKAGKTTLLKEVAKSVKRSNPDIHMIILLIDERPEEVTDMIEEVGGPGVEVIYSTFDETAEHHKRVAEMVIERARRMVEYRKDVIILLDSITRLTRAYNQVVPPSGRTLSGGLDPAALHMPKRFFGAARNMREGGSLTILATALVDTGSKMDDVVYEEFKGTGNMELVLDRKLSERRIFPAIDIPKSSTRREDLLLTPDELAAMSTIRKAINGIRPDEAVDKIIDMFSKTMSNNDFVQIVQKTHW